MLRQITLLTVAFTLLFTAGASAEGVIAGQAVEIREIDRKAVGTAYFVRLSDGRTLKITPQATSALVASQLLLPEALVALPEAQVVAARRHSSPGAPVIAAPVPRGVEPVPVFVVESDRAVDAGTTKNAFPAQVVTLATLQPGVAIAVPGGEPIVREEGYYVRGSESDDVVLQSIRLRDGRWVTIADRAQRTSEMLVDVDFDPAALEPGKYVRLIRREDGSYFLSAARPPRTVYAGVTAGRVGRVDSKAAVIELADGSMIHPRHRASAVLTVGDQPVETAALRTGDWIVIDAHPALAVEAPSALPADTLYSGRVLRILPRPGAQ